MKPPTNHDPDRTTLPPGLRPGTELPTTRTGPRPGDEPTTNATTAIAAPQDRGKTIVTGTVIATIARLAAEQVEGVHHVGGQGLRGALGRLGSGGVDAEVGMKEAAVTLDVVVVYGYRIRHVAAEVRQRVLDSVALMASRDIVAVDINVVGVHVTKPSPEPDHQLS